MSLPCLSRVLDVGGYLKDPNSEGAQSWLLELQVIGHGNWPLGFGGIIFSYDMLYRTFRPWPYEELMRSELRVYTITEEVSFFVNIS